MTSRDDRERARRGDTIAADALAALGEEYFALVRAIDPLIAMQLGVSKSAFGSCQAARKPTGPRCGGIRRLS